MLKNRDRFAVQLEIFSPIRFVARQSVLVDNDENKQAYPVSSRINFFSIFGYTRQRTAKLLVIESLTKPSKTR